MPKHPASLIMNITHQDGSFVTHTGLVVTNYYYIKSANETLALWPSASTRRKSLGIVVSDLH